MSTGHSILSLSIKEKTSLYAAYMPFVKNGGLFIPTTRNYSLGEEVFMLLSLMDEPERIPIAGKVIWITPRGASSSRTPGIGVQFNDLDEGSTRNKMETLLGPTLQADRPTHTM
ncbi:MAG TPA: pilus assembly protein PilZ [Gammaproteobacteria bacterium]|nr:pilus assembly protein PilZ [Gammaproteobacteria bacterium]